MRKNIKLFLTFFVLLISYFWFTNQANALIKTWDFSVPLEYTASDSTLVEIIKRDVPAEGNLFLKTSKFNLLISLKFLVFYI